MKALIKKSAFTLIELCVVIALIIVLTTIISKTRSKIKEKSIELKDKTQLKTIVEAVKSFEQDFGKFPTNLGLLSSANKIRTFAGHLGIRLTDKYSPYLTVKDSAPIYYKKSQYMSCSDGSRFNSAEHAVWPFGYKSSYDGKRCCDLKSVSCTNIVSYLTEYYSVPEGTSGALDADIPADSNGNIIYYFAYPKEYIDSGTGEAKGNWFAIIMSGPDGECSFDDEFALNSYTLTNLFLSVKPMGNREYSIIDTLSYDENDSRNKDNIVYFSANCPFN